MRTKTTICNICGKQFSYEIGFGVGANLRKTCSIECRKQSNRLYCRSSRPKRFLKSLFAVKPQQDFILFYDLLWENVPDDEVGFEVKNEDVENLARSLTIERESRLEAFKLKTFCRRF